MLTAPARLQIELAGWQVQSESGPACSYCSWRRAPGGRSSASSATARPSSRRSATGLSTRIPPRPAISVARAHANFARCQARINLEQVKWSLKSRVAGLPSGDGGLPSGAGEPCFEHLWGERNATGAQGDARIAIGVGSCHSIHKWFWRRTRVAAYFRKPHHSATAKQ